MALTRHSVPAAVWRNHRDAMLDLLAASLLCLGFFALALADLFMRLG